MKLKHVIITLSLCIFVGFGSFAQRQIVKGLRVPSLTTEQRDQIPVDGRHAGGLLIFNTDINCQEFWNGSAWISLCGEQRPEVKIAVEDCDRIRVFGNYFVNAPLNYTHFITLPVTVTQTGAYTISARSGNGYFFHTSGVFEELGVYQLTLTGMGTPRVAQKDSLVFTINGTEIGTSCDITIDVISLRMAYTVDCHEIQVIGEYRAGRLIDTDHYAIVPINVLALGTATIRTDVQNGIRFSGTKELTELGPTEIILIPYGTPFQEGPFRFNFVTDGDIETMCSFIVRFVSTLGTFDDPACSCFAIFQQRPFAPNGEYWLQDCRDIVGDGDESDEINVQRFRTFCDIAGGGWTLVWSYSERTARYVYIQHSSSPTSAGNRNSMRVSPAHWHFSFDRPRPIGAIYDETCDDPERHQINYYDFRLPREAWRFATQDPNRQQMKVRITEDPTDMRDVWALNNFAIYSASSRAQNPIEQTWGHGFVSTSGRIFGKRWEVRAGAGWDEVSGRRLIRTRNSTGNLWGGLIWEWDNKGSGTYFEVRPNLGGEDNRMRMNAINYTFGNFNATMPNHHFGKCGRDSDDFCFSRRTCGHTNLFPHSFNNGEGRILQWFVR